MKDYFQDIVPPGGGEPRPQRKHPQQEPPREVEVMAEAVSDDMSDDTLPATPQDRSIRNVRIEPSRPRKVLDIPQRAPRPVRARRRMWPFFIAIVAISLVGVLVFVSLRPTRITVIPRTYDISFDNANRYTAYPSASAAAGALAYSVKVINLEESEVVASNGTVRSEEKASGQITVFNAYSADPVKLLVNTRFATPDGKIFKAPAEVMVPGKVGTTPGQRTITVIAEKAGQEYNVGPFSRLTLPGLQSTPDMYAKVYAQSSAAFSGGFVGEKAGVAQGDAERALAEMRSRLESKAREMVKALDTEGDVVFSDLMRIAFTSAPPTPESAGMVRLHEKASVSVPVFPAAAFAEAIALSVSVDAANSSIEVVPGQGYGAQLVSSATSTLGVDMIQFALIGKAQILWQVNSSELANALAGKDSDAFQTIVSTFPAIEEARARIQPFWSSKFPSKPASINVVVASEPR